MKTDSKNEEGYEYKGYGYNQPQLNEMDLAANGSLKPNNFSGSHEAKPNLSPNTVLNMDTWDNNHSVQVETFCGFFTMGSLHSGGANYSFLDGHVKWLFLTEQGRKVCEAQSDR